MKNDANCVRNAMFYLLHCFLICESRLGAQRQPRCEREAPRLDAFAQPAPRTPAAPASARGRSRELMQNSGPDNTETDAVELAARARAATRGNGHAVSATVEASATHDAERARYFTAIVIYSTGYQIIWVSAII